MGPTYLHFGTQKSILGRLGASLGRLGPSWERLGGVLGASWGRLGPSWGPLGRILAHLGTSWRVLGRLGAVLAPFWPEKKNLALQWNGKRAYLWERFHFEGLCCFAMQLFCTRCFESVYVVSSCLLKKTSPRCIRHSTNSSMQQ